MKNIIRNIEDWFLAVLQKRCDHPGQMISVDILEGSGGGWKISYCNRCGAVQPNFTLVAADSVIRESAWRRPNPNLWR